MVILFLCRSLWIFAFCRFFISLCFSNIFAYVIFFWFYVYSWIFLSSINWLFMFFLYFNPDLVDAIFWNSQAWNEELQNMKSLKEQKTVSLFLCISLWIFAFFFSILHLTLFLWHLGIFYFLGVMCVPEFFGDQWTKYNIGHGQISDFRRKQLILLNVFDLILLFLRRFLIYFIFFFYLYPYLFFFMLWFTFFLWFNNLYSRLLKTKK